MLERETIYSINQEIRSYGTKVKTNTVKQHLMFLKNMGNQFKGIKGSDFDVSILATMELLLDRIIDDVEDERHQKEKIDQNLIKTLNDLINLNGALVRGAKKDKDDSEDWIERLRKYIKILRNLSIAAVLIASNEHSEKMQTKAKSDIKIIFDWTIQNTQ
jgi:hypothetical protein